MLSGCLTMQKLTFLLPLCWDSVLRLSSENCSWVFGCSVSYTLLDFRDLKSRGWRTTLRNRFVRSAQTAKQATCKKTQIHPAVQLFNHRSSGSAVNQTSLPPRTARQTVTDEAKIQPDFIENVLISKCSVCLDVAKLRKEFIYWLSWDLGWS